MSILFEDIYAQAIGLFQDPFISNAYNTSPIQFFQTMNTYMQNAIIRFNNPSLIQDTLALVTSPIGQQEEFTGDGSTVTYTLSTTPLSNSYFDYTVNGITTNLNSNSYNPTTNQITLPSAVLSGTQFIIQWYFAGEFLDPQNLLDTTAQNILARLILVCWSERERNFLLDIRRLLGDTDFKLISEANSLNSKSNWYDDIRTEAEKKMNQYSWSIRFKNWANTGTFKGKFS